MSVQLRFHSPSDGNPIRRSRSFAGLGSLTGRRRPSAARNSLRSQAPTERKFPRGASSPGRAPGSVWSPRPEDVDAVFRALRKGLREHVERHQTEMDFLSTRQTQTKRNSRLGFQYDLEKEIRAQERWMRKLEFQVSKVKSAVRGPRSTETVSALSAQVDELYENYCVQWRLCQGAVNMKRAFALAPSTRQSRESLLDLGRNHRLSTQDMSNMEGELEGLLGELHVKMKGLVGFARLCPGDQYEVAVQLGRQRWKIRGRIQSDDVQSWEQEEMLFLPRIGRNFEIKVSEAKGLGWQLVGTVTCASAPFLVATPQLVVVDITQLGTIKLQLEVTWSPLDGGDKAGLSSGARPPGWSRKTSVQSWTAPSTPSFSEKYFQSMMRELREGGGGGGGASVPLRVSARGRDRGVSLMSYLSYSSIASSPSRARTTPSVAGSRTQLSLGEDDEEPVTMRRRRGRRPEEEQETPAAAWGQLFSHPLSLVDARRSSTPDILKDNPAGGPAEKRVSAEGQRLNDAGPKSPISGSPISGSPISGSPIPESPIAGSPIPESPGTGPPGPGSLIPEYGGSESPGPESPPPYARAGPGSSERRAQALRLGALLAELERNFRRQSGGQVPGQVSGQVSGQVPPDPLSLLEQRLQHLATVLRNQLSLMRRSSSNDTLAVEEVLCSFDFLSHDDNASCLGETSATSLRNDDRSGEEGEEPPPPPPPVAPLTCGNWGLDRALEAHLDSCCILLEMLPRIDFTLTRAELLEDVAQQADVLNTIGRLLLEDGDVSAEKLLPEDQRTPEVLAFWADCGAGDAASSPFCCHSHDFVAALGRRYSHRIKAKLKAKQPGLPEKVFQRLLRQVQAASRAALWPPQPPCAPDRVSVFQLSIYLGRCRVPSPGDHVARLAKEERFLSAVTGPGRKSALGKMTSRVAGRLVPLGSTLRTLAALQADGDLKVRRAAARCLKRAGACGAFRAKALVYYTESLRSTDADTQRNSCWALKCLAVRGPDALRLRGGRPMVEMFGTELALAGRGEFGAHGGTSQIPRRRRAKRRQGGRPLFRQKRSRGLSENGAAGFGDAGGLFPKFGHRGHFFMSTTCFCLDFFPQMCQMRCFAMEF
ncbi:RIPOR family member 3 isoform X2 [Stigmatopora nigra]